ncbi:MAG: hypothetical protein R2862_11190 [Thermoanaerobaculia bacterium]
MIRSILTVLVGLLVGSLAGFLLGLLGNRLMPPPAGLNLANPEALAAYVASAPPAVFLKMMAVWAGGAFAGGFAAALLAARQRSWHAIAVGAIQMFLALAQMAMIPHPAWVVVSGATLFIPFAWLGSRLLVGTPDAPPDAPEAT